MECASLALELGEQPLDVCFSPVADILAVGLVDGTLHCYNAGRQPASADAALHLQCELVWNAAARGGASCRAVAFTVDGVSLLSGHADRSMALWDVESGKVRQRNTDAHSEAVSRVMAASAQLVVSGDEGGGVRAWDLRARRCVWSDAQHTDYVSDFALHVGEQCVVATSGDGTVSVHDLQKGRCRSRSESDADDELLSCVVVKQGRKVVCGSGSGVLGLYSWGAMADCSDRFPGHPESVDALVALDEDTLVSSSSDGVLRLLSVLPNKLLGVLGAHGDMPVERLTLSHNKQLLASASHDSTVKLWDVGWLNDEEADEQEAEAGERVGTAGQQGEPGCTSPAAALATDTCARGEEVPAVRSAAGSDDGGGSDGSDSDDAKASKRAGKKRKRKAQQGKAGSGRKHANKSNFFCGLL